MSAKTLSLLVRVINSNPIKKTKKYMFIFLEPIKHLKPVKKNS